MNKLRIFSKSIRREFKFADLHRGMYVVCQDPRANIEQMCSYFEGFWKGAAIGLQYGASSDFAGAFSRHLREEYGWSASLGPARMLIDNCASPGDAWERFWVELRLFAKHSENLG